MHKKYRDKNMFKFLALFAYKTIFHQNKYDNDFKCTWAEGSSALLWLHVFRRPSLTFHIFDFSKTDEQNSTKLDRKQDLNVLYKVCVFRANWKS